MQMKKLEETGQKTAEQTIERTDMPVDPTDAKDENLNTILNMSTEKELEKGIAMVSQYEFHE